MVTVKNFLVLLIFDRRNRLLVRTVKSNEIGLSHFLTTDTEYISSDLLDRLATFPSEKYFLTERKKEDKNLTIYCTRKNGLEDVNTVYMSLDEIRTQEENNQLNLTPILAEILREIEPHLVKIPYLELNENEYIYRFRTLKERNSAVYIDRQSNDLYYSKLCRAIKAVRRIKEKVSDTPATLDFGAVSYIIPSHFGFCLGVQNAIERAYETVSANPDKRVFMLSELIHNPFVNQDLLARGIRYLQTDKGLPYLSDGSVGTNPNDPNTLWNQLKSDDVVIIPAFGATNEDKVRLMRRGLDIYTNDATCMLVEKVWKSARRYAEEGFTVLIHGKSKHEETKATFSNSSKYGPALIIHDIEHAKQLTKVIQSSREEKKRLFENAFKGLYSEGFDLEKDLRKLAVVNQTTLLRNETLKIIEFLHEFTRNHYGEAQVGDHLWLKGKGDTLCYATQVNQDALQKAIEQPVDAALVVGGKNSSNTFQLYRVCKERFNEKAHYIQSESNILSAEKIRHYIFPHKSNGFSDVNDEVRPFLSLGPGPKRILLTGGASCPDGIIQQIIHKINIFFPTESIRSIDTVLESIEKEI